MLNSCEGTSEQFDTGTCRPRWCRVCRQCSASLATSEDHLWVSVLCYQTYVSAWWDERPSTECNTVLYIFCYYYTVIYRHRYDNNKKQELPATLVL